MAEETDLSRTEPASPRRLHAARSRGDVPRSRELTAWVVLLSALAALGWLASRWLATLKAFMASSLGTAAQPFPEHPFASIVALLGSFLPLLGIVFVAVLTAPMLLSGWVFAPRAFAFDAQRLNPVTRLARLFSVESLFEAGKLALKFALVAGALGWALLDTPVNLRSLPGLLPERAFDEITTLMGNALLAVLGALALVAALDGGWRWWRYRRRHAMTWQEVLNEAREAEGSPEMRARMREKQHQANAGPRAPSRFIPGRGWSLPSRSEGSPQVGEPPEGHIGANAGPNAIDEVIG